jgi:putative transposase
MPTHIHIIAGSKNGGPGISKFIHSFKGRVRESLIGKGKLWQDRFDDLLLKTMKQFKVKLDYIHFNPVKSGLVDKPEDWPFSSYTDWCERNSSRGIIFDFDWL